MSAAEVGSFAKRGERVILLGLLSALTKEHILSQLIAALSAIEESVGGLGVILREHMVVLVEADAPRAADLVSAEVLALLSGSAESDPTAREG
ncbi:hypothetical protein HR12_39730 [Microbacterium sp. SUBG005]|nr:hypothetical protein HR12_39730 [Microbacterium sp. SUBG005]